MRRLVQAFGHGMGVGRICVGTLRLRDWEEGKYCGGVQWGDGRGGLWTRWWSCGIGAKELIAVEENRKDTQERP